VEETPRSKKSILIVLLVAILVLSVLVSLKVDFDNRDRLFQNVVKDSPDGMEAFGKLAQVTPSDAVIFSWWDYGRAIQEFGQRRPVVAYPSKDILQSVGATQNPIYALEMQLFGTFEPSDKIHEVARAFLLPEDESLMIMRRYGATHVMVFLSQDERGAFNDLEKFVWIATIAGYNASDYMRVNYASARPTYELTSKAEQATMLRLLFDERFHPQHFTKLYENRASKIYRIDYPTPASTESAESMTMVQAAALAPLTVGSVLWAGRPKILDVKFADADSTIVCAKATFCHSAIRLTEG
jgi:asparagine N-glycosylation enzyme membrane subunit Stt3